MTSPTSQPLHPLPHIPLPNIPSNGIAQRLADNCTIDESSERVRWIKERIVAGAASPLISLLNIQWQSIGMQRCVCRMQVDRRHLQPYGLVHGGINALLAEHVGSMMGILHASTGCVGVSVDAHHAASAKPGDVLEAECTPIRIGQTLALWKVIVTAISPDGKRKTAGICKMMTMRRPSRAVEAMQRSERKAQTSTGISSNLVRPVTDQAAAKPATKSPSPAADAQKSLEAEQKGTQIDCDKFDIRPIMQNINTTKESFKPTAANAYVDPSMQKQASQMLMSPLSTLLGLKYTHVAPKRLEAELTVGIQHMQPFAIANGGVSAVIAEELGSVLSSINWLLSGTSSSTPPPVGSWVEVQHLGSAFEGDTIRGVCTGLKVGKQSQLWQIDLFARSASSKKERHMASCQLTTMQQLPKQIRAKV